MQPSRQLRQQSGSYAHRIRSFASLHPTLSGTFEAYQIAFKNDDADEPVLVPGLSGLLFVESDPVEAVVAHHNRTTGSGPDHQILVPASLSATPAVGSEDPPLTAGAIPSLSIPGSLDGNLLGVDIGSAGAAPSWVSDGNPHQSVAVSRRGDRTGLDDYALGDPRSERSSEPFLLSLEPDQLIQPSTASTLITLLHDDPSLELQVHPIAEISNATLSGRDFTLTATLTAETPISSDRLSRGRVMLQRPGDLPDLRLGSFAFEADGLSSSLSASARLQLPVGLSAVDLSTSDGFRVVVDLGDDVIAQTDAFSWHPSAVALELIEIPSSSRGRDSWVGDDSLNPTLTFDVGDGVGLETLNLALSRDSLFSSADTSLSLPTQDSPSIPTGPQTFTNSDLSESESADVLAQTRWLIQAQFDSMSDQTLHQAYYRPTLIAGVQNQIEGLALPPALVQASGDQPMRLTISNDTGVIWPVSSPASAATAAEWNQELGNLVLTFADPGEHQLQLRLEEASDAAGALTVFSQSLVFSSTPPESTPTESLAVPQPVLGSPLQMTEGTGLLLVDLDEDGLSILSDNSQLAAQLLNQLRLLGFENPDLQSQIGSSIVSLKPFLADNSGVTNGQGITLNQLAIDSDGEVTPARAFDFNHSSGPVRVWVITPPSDLAGTFDLVASYSDGLRQGTSDVQLTIANTPDAPQLIASQRSQLHHVLQTGPRPVSPDPDAHVINLATLVDDPDPIDDGGALSFRLADGAVLPEGVDFLSDTNQISFSALPHASAGEHLFSIIVSDGDEKHDDLELRFDLQINPLNFAPVWGLPAQLQASLDGPARWDFRQPDSTRPWALDPDGDSLRFAVSSPLPGGVIFDSGVLSVDPQTAEAGRYPLSFTVTDGPNRSPVSATTVLELSTVAPESPATLLPIPSDQLQLLEGQKGVLTLNLDRPLSADATIHWSLAATDDDIELGAQHGFVELVVGDSSLQIPYAFAEDERVSGDTDLLLLLRSSADELALPEQPLSLRLLDNDGLHASLETRWISSTEVELVYIPARERRADTGLRLEITDPSGLDLLKGATLSDLFALGWQGMEANDHSVSLHWSDPLAGAWPALAEVVLGRLQLQHQLSDSPRLELSAEAGAADVVVRWSDDPWSASTAAPPSPQEAALAAAQASGSPVLMEAAMASAVQLDADAQLVVTDVPTLLERRFSTSPTIEISTGGRSYTLDLQSSYVERKASVQVDPQTWGLMPPLADGAERTELQAEQVLVLSTQQGELTDVSLAPASGDIMAQFDQGFTFGSGGSDLPLQPLYGVIEFTLSDVDPGSLQSIWLDLPYKAVVDGVLSKPDKDGRWSAFEFDANDGTGAIFYDDDDDGFDDRLEIRLRDGGRGDADGVINGEIVDPAIASSSDVSNDPQSPTHVDMVLGHLLGMHGTLDSNSDAIDALSFTVAAGQRLWTLKIDDLTRKGSPVEACIFSENDSIDLETTTPQILTASSTELLSVPLASGHYTLVLRQLSGTSSYALRGVAEEVVPAPATFTVTSAPTALNEGSTFSTTIDTTNVDPGTALYWRLEPHDGSEINADDFTSAISGSVTLDQSGHAVIETSTEADLTTEGAEQFFVAVYSDPQYTALVGSGAAITIRDTSVAPVASYALQSSASVDEGSTFAANVVTSNVADGTTLHWQLRPVGDSAITQDDFTTATTGSVVIGKTGVGDINIEVSNDYLTEGGSNSVLNFTWMVITHSVE